MADDFVVSPMKPIAECPKGYGPTGPGALDSEPGFPKRTPSPNAVPEKVRDGSMPTSKDRPFDASGPDGGK